MSTAPVFIDNPQAWRPIRCEACAAIVHGRDCAECGAPLGRKHQSDIIPAPEETR